MPKIINMFVANDVKFKSKLYLNEDIKVENLIRKEAP